MLGCEWLVSWPWHLPVARTFPVRKYQAMDHRRSQRCCTQAGEIKHFQVNAVSKPGSFLWFVDDDLIILSRSKTGLQNCLNTLATYCNTWMLSVNPKKTKIMVFQKRAKKCSEQTFYIGNQAIDVVQDYTYLGTKISSSGNFKISLDHLKEKALHALFSLRRHKF